LEAFAFFGRHRSPPETNTENRSPAVLFFDFLRALCELSGANPFNSNWPPSANGPAVTGYLNF
jgi:hypothetical protein